MTLLPSYGVRDHSKNNSVKIYLLHCCKKNVVDCTQKYLFDGSCATSDWKADTHVVAKIPVPVNFIAKLIVKTYSHNGQREKRVSFINFWLENQLKQKLQAYLKPLIQVEHF